MAKKSRTALLRLFAVLMSLALITAACGSTTDTSDDGTTSSTDGANDDGNENQTDSVRVCVNNEPNPDLKLEGIDYEFVYQLCTTFGDEQLEGVTLRSCGQGLFPEIFRSQADGQPEYLFWSHGYIRFHPADDIEPRGPEALDPRSYFGDLSGDVDPTNQVIVIDAGLHLQFVSAIIGEMTGNTILIDERDLTPAAQGQVDPDTWLVGELEIVEVMKQVEGGEGVWVNTSFGTYTCSGDGPEMLKAEMSRLADNGVKFFASAGNDETDQKAFPAGFGTTTSAAAADVALAEAVTSVGSTLTADPPTRSCFSNYGEVEAWVPGQEVFIDGLGQWSGTSFATPLLLSLALANVDPSKFSSTPLPPADTYTYDWDWPAGTTRTGETFCPGDGDYAPRLPGITYTS